MRPFSSRLTGVRNGWREHRLSFAGVTELSPSARRFKYAVGSKPAHDGPPAKNRGLGIRRGLVVCPTFGLP